jgi:hypothetical protein
MGPFEHNLALLLLLLSPFVLSGIFTNFFILGRLGSFAVRTTDLSSSPHGRGCFFALAQRMDAGFSNPVKD